MKDFEKALHGALHAEAEPTDALNRRVLEKANRKRYSGVYKGLKIAAGCAAAFVIGVTALAIRARPWRRPYKMCRLSEPLPSW